jgi:2-keto-4-pentenoate hydratase/2-oxohepta-3-ene-1,7-dioic acid hydratase in catechol pathway
MRFLVFEADGQYQLGIKTARGVLDVATARTATGVDTPATPDAFYQRGTEALASFATLVERATDAALYHDESTLTLAPIVPNPGKIICVGLNYRKHAEETGAKIPPYPILFSKFNNTIAAPGEGIPITPSMGQADYEAELLVVMGKTAKDVSEADALDYVLGYACANDLSERNFQLRSGQWLIGKTLDKFLPIGPYLVTADEAGDPQAMPVKGWLNDELRQNSSSADMIFTVAQCIAYASQFMTLQPGDIISTGTPEGVILGMADKVWLKPGDEYTVEIGNLGRLTNRMIEG